jgi:hypothetical protein
MVSFRKLLLSAAVMTMAVCTGFAQTGTITVTGTDPVAVSLTNSTETALSSTIALGVLTPANNNTLTTSTPVEVRLRSNKAYNLTAAASALTFTAAGSDDGGSPIALTDIGFGVTSSTLTGANVANTGSRTDTVAAGYSVATWPTPTNGLTPAFTKTLNNITGAGVQIISGSRISAKGNLATDNNYISLFFGVATLPQFFTPNSGFSTTVTLTIAAP